MVFTRQNNTTEGLGGGPKPDLVTEGRNVVYIFSWAEKGISVPKKENGTGDRKERNRIFVDGSYLGKRGRRRTRSIGSRGGSCETSALSKGSTEAWKEGRYRRPMRWGDSRFVKEPKRTEKRERTWV